MASDRKNPAELGDFRRNASPFLGDPTDKSPRFVSISISELAFLVIPGDPLLAVTSCQVSTYPANNRFREGDDVEPIFLSSVDEYRQKVAATPGKYVLLDVALGDSAEALRVNVKSDRSSSYRRAPDDFAVRFDSQQPPFTILPSTVCFSFETVGQLAANFATVRECVGDNPIGNIPLASPENERILNRLQQKKAELLRIAQTCHDIEVETAIYKAYHLNPPKLGLMEGESPSELGIGLLSHFDEAVRCYSQLPELLDFHDDEGRGTGHPSRRGDLLRCFAQSNPNALFGTRPEINWIDYEVSPLVIRLQRWNQPAENDIRRDSIDLLLQLVESGTRYPLACEVKMRDDKWTSAALQQILYYGSMMASDQQRRRLRKHFPDRFDSEDLWLGLIVEERPGDDFQRDFCDTLLFAKHPTATQTLGRHFAGMLMILIGEASGTAGSTTKWEERESHLVDWRRPNATSTA